MNFFGVGQNTARNDTDIAQTITVALTESSTDTSTFEYTLGINVEVKAGIKATWARLVDAKIEVTTAVKSEWKWGTQNADTKTFTTTLAVAAKPWSEVTAIATATKSDIELPFTITWKSKKTGYEVQTKGVYKGTNYWNTKTTFKQVPDGESREMDQDDESQEWEEADVVERVENIQADEMRSFGDKVVEGRNDGYEGSTPQDDGK